jgi:hypothetical protein
MKKKIKKLTLHRETLMTLNDREAEMAAGATPANITQTKVCCEISLSYCSACCT